MSWPGRPRTTILKTGAALSICVALIVGISNFSCQSCDCFPDAYGLVVTTAGPITAVTLSGVACTGARFRCVPADFDSVIHDPCNPVQIEPKAEGLCVVDLTVAGSPVHVERNMSRRPPGCCGGDIGEAGGNGYIDLTKSADAGADAASDLGSD